MGTFSVGKKHFLLNGKPFTVLSGAMHYFRIPAAYRRDRLQKLKECGFNTVETYTAWNLHEPREGEFCFSDMLDIGAYADEAAALGLYMIVRPGPYICAEWEGGGLPAWLLSYEGMELRCNDGRFLEKVGAYFRVLFDILRPRLITNGGNILMMQIENEYGSYGNDADYKRALEKMYRNGGIDVPLFTSDGATPRFLNGGTLPGHLCVANFGSRPEENFAALQKFRREQPLMCGEYWCGWFDHWYEPHHTRDPKEVAAVFDKMLSMGASVNFYMFHGGTNFGFTNGANEDERYQPTVTSYDYAAPLSEAGDLTPAYFAVRAVIEKHFGRLPPLTVSDSVKKSYGKVRFSGAADFLDAAKAMHPPVTAPAPLFQESIGQSVGYTVYSVTVRDPEEGERIFAEEIRDRAIFFLDGKRIGRFENGRENAVIRIPETLRGDVRLDILLENMGRVNYGVHLCDRKGISKLRIERQFQYGFDMIPMEMTAKDLAKIRYGAVHPSDGRPCFLRGVLRVDGEPADSFVRLDGFHHGFVAVNGFNLGRYDNDAGPQKTLYCPASVLRRGENEVVVFETDGFDKPFVTFTDTPDLG